MRRALSNRTAWFLSPGPGWLRYGDVEVDCTGLDEEDIACVVQQLSVEFPHAFFVPKREFLDLARRFGWRKRVIGRCKSHGCGE